MLNNPLVSILINNYNYEKFLPEAIDSCIQQTYRNFEIIIVDDGSTDSSRDIIDTYYKQYPELITPVYKENGGQGSAYNKGFETSHGEIICFLDSDDYWFSNKLQQVVKAHKEYDVVQHNLLKNDNKFRVYNNEVDRQKLLKECGYYGSFSPSSALSFTRKVLQNVFPIPEEPLRICADAFVRNSAVYFSQIYSIDECLGVYRIHGKNLWQNDIIQESEAVSRNSFEILELLNQRLISQGLIPIPYINKYLSERVFKNSFTIEKDKSYLLYGTGDGGRKMFEYVRKCGSEVAFFSDSNSEKWGNDFMGIPIISPYKIKDIRPKFEKIIISSMYLVEIHSNLINIEFEDQKDIIYPINYI